MTEEIKEKNFSRRKFIKRAIAIAVSFELFYVLFDLIGKKRPNADSTNYFNAGKISSFENDKIYPFTSGRFYLSRFADGGFLAISIKCTHLGCMVQPDVKTEGFACPCHASKFDKYGEVLSPPATRALDLFNIIIENGEVKIDTQNPIRRKGFDKKQLTYS